MGKKEMKDAPTLCRLGFHKWLKWKFIERIVIPERVSQFGIVEVRHVGIDGDAMERSCKRCGTEQVELRRHTLTSLNVTIDLTGGKPQ